MVHSQPRGPDQARCPLWVISGHLQCNSPCPLYPRKRTCAVQFGMSVKGQKRTFAMQKGMSALPQRSVQAWPCLPDHARQLRRTQYFLEISISEDKDNYYGRVHCNDEPKQNPSLSTQPLYFIAGLSESL